QNCVSYRSYLYNDTFVKIEKLEGNKPVRIISTPVKAGGRRFIVEMIKKIDYNMSGVEDEELNESISDVMNELNLKVITDELTGVYNRRFINERINVDIFKQRKKEESYTIVMADIDFFKNVNDNYGHLAGDLVLIEVAQIIYENMNKNSGWVGRYGGEEFIFVYYTMNLDDVIKNIEQIRRKIEEKVFRYNDSEIKVTASFGVAELDHKHNNGCEIIEEADKMLYKAKENGRNRIEYTI
ncbi:MAG: GGDEF domain-containing protein, partial [Clostridium sp.]|nr:GGDEF domain-containing protein [Clostridium sp.]